MEGVPSSMGRQALGKQQLFRTLLCGGLMDWLYFIPMTLFSLFLLRLVQSHSIVDIICLDCDLLPKRDFWRQPVKDTSHEVRTSPLFIGQL